MDTIFYIYKKTAIVKFVPFTAIKPRKNELKKK